MYEVVEAAGEWIVRRGELELARYDAQAAALQAVSERLRLENASDAPVSFGMRFQSRTRSGAPGGRASGRLEPQTRISK